MKWFRESQIIIFVFSLIMVGLPTPINSEALGPVVINEIGAYESSNHEWVEIYVIGDQAIDMNNWKFYENEIAHGLELYQGEDMVLAVGEYAIIADVAENFVLDYPDFLGKVFDSSWSSLKEGGEQIGLIDADDNIVELFEYLSCADFSLERADPALLDYSEMNWQEHASNNTVGEENSNYVSELEIDETPLAEVSDLNIETIISLSWEPSPSEDAIGYVIYVEDGHDYGEAIDVGDVVNYDFIDLSYGLNYYFQVVAYDSDGNESLPQVIDLLAPESIECPEPVCQECEVCEVAEVCETCETCEVCEVCLECETCEVCEICDPSTGSGSIEECDECICEEEESGYQVGSIKINEFLPNPKGSDTDSEWIELKNVSSSVVDLEGWRLSDSTSRKYTIDSVDFSTTLVQPNGYFVLYKEDSSISLNNSSGDQVRLFYPEGDQVADQVIYSAKAEEDVSYAKNSSGSWQWTITLTPSGVNIITLPPAGGDDEPDLSAAIIPEEIPEVIPPTAPEVVATKIDYEIIITEVVPNPEGSDDYEWIEIKNNGQRVNLKGCYVDDEEGGSRPFEIKENLWLSRDGYYVFKREETKIALNNTGDSVRLLDPEMLVIDEVVIDETQEAFSYARLNNSWYWSTKLTPGKDNKFSEPEESPSASSGPAGDVVSKDTGGDEAVEVVEATLIEAREMKLGQKVKVQGTVSVEPGILGTQIFYLAGSGMQVYMYKKDFPDMEVGDIVEITGELAESSGERRIKVTAREDIVVLEEDDEPEPHEVELIDVDESKEGWLVNISGQVIEKKGSSIFLDNGVDEVRVYVKKNTKISTKEIEEGDELSVVGIVSQNKDGYQVMPRRPEDVEVARTEIEPQVLGAEFVESNSGTKETQKYLWVGLGFIVLVLAAILWKKRDAILEFARTKKKNGQTGKQKNS